MKRWEFLIQQEGDCTWLPIQQPTLEIVAGNYRLVAHVSRPHLNVDIHITHETEEEGQILRHCQSHSRRTNAEGLITILPWGELQPGNWKISCYGDVMSELLGESWQESLQLQVLPSTVDSDDSELKTLEMGEEIEELQFNQELEPENALLTADITAFEDIFAPALRLSLERDTLIRSQGEGIVITGKVEAATPQQADFPLSGKLRLKLKNADSEEILLVREYPLPAESLPFNFSYTLDLSPDEEIPLLVGEAILEGVGGTCLARQSFTIATDFNCLAQEEESVQESQKHMNYVIELASTEGDSSFAFDLLIPEEIATASLPLNLAEPAKMINQKRQPTPAAHSALPPKINRSSGAKSLKRPLLPKLPSPQLPQPQPPAEVLSKETASQPSLQGEKVMAEGQPKELRLSTEREATAVAVGTESPTGKIPPSADSQPQPLAGEEALQSLKFQERFLSRLNSLATGTDA